MELVFNKQQDGWIAEFQASSDFNLHIEGVAEGNISLYQKGINSGRYAYVKGSTPCPSAGNVYDYEFPVLVGPKFIKVVCLTEPTYAAVTSSGEITELLYQEKSIEVKDNGTTVVTPDAGFMALSKVEVKTNVPKSEGGSGGGSNVIEYLYLLTVAGTETGAVMRLTKSIVFEWKGKNMMTSNLMPIRISNYSNASMTSQNVFKVIKGIVVIDGVEYDNTSYEKLLESNGIDSSYFTEITEEEYNNYTV